MTQPRQARRTRQQPSTVPGPSPDHDRGEDDLDAYIKDVVDALPPLTDEQRDLLAMIFRSGRRRKLPGPATRRPASP